jgi:hypothetical protein
MRWSTTRVGGLVSPRESRFDSGQYELDGEVPMSDLVAVKHNGAMVMINLDQVTRIMPNGSGGSVIYFTDGGTLSVQQGATEIRSPQRSK